MKIMNFQVRDETYVALKAAAATQGVSNAELARRLLARGLALQTADAQAEVLALAIRRELAPVRTMVYLAAREAARARYWSRAAAISAYLESTGGNREHLKEWIAQCDDTAIKQALLLLRDRNLERTDEQAVAISDMTAILAGGDADTVPDEEEPVVALSAEEAQPFEGQEQVADDEADQPEG